MCAIDYRINIPNNVYPVMLIPIISLLKNDCITTT